MPYNPYFDPIMGPRFNPYGRIMPVGVPIAVPVVVPVAVAVPVAVPVPAKQHKESSKTSHQASNVRHVNGGGYIEGEARDDRTRRQPTQGRSRTVVEDRGRGMEVVRHREQTQRREPPRQTRYADCPRQSRYEQPPAQGQRAPSRYQDQRYNDAPPQQGHRTERRTQRDDRNFVQQFQNMNMHDRHSRRQTHYEQDRTHNQSRQPMQPIYEERYPPPDHPMQLGRGEMRARTHYDDQGRRTSRYER